MLSHQMPFRCRLRCQGVRGAVEVKGLAGFEDVVGPYFPEHLSPEQAEGKTLDAPAVRKQGGSGTVTRDIERPGRDPFPLV